MRITVKLLAACMALLTHPLCARAAEDAAPAMAVRIHQYAEVRRLAGDYLGRLLPDYHLGLADTWLANALHTGGIEGIDQNSSIYFLAVQPPAAGTPPAWTVVVPLQSPSMHLDALRANLGQESSTDGDSFIFKLRPQPEAGEPGGELHLLLTDRYSVLSRTAESARRATAMIENEKLPPLFCSSNEPGIQMRLSGQFIAARHDAFYGIIYRMMLMGSAAFGSINAAGYAEFYTKAALEFAESCEYLSIDFRPDPEIMTVRITIRPKPGSLMSRFLSAQKPMKPSLLKLIPGDPVFAAEGRAESLGELQEAFPAAVRRMFGLLPTRLSFSDAAGKRAGERIAAFNAAFTGHAAAALVQPPRDSFGVDYLRIYELKDAALAREYFVKSTESRATIGETVTALPEEEHGGRTIAAYEVSAPPAMLKNGGDRQPATIRAAVTDKYMLIASGMHSKENICRLIDAAAQPPQSPAAKSPHFCKAMAEAPENAAGVAYFSITSFLNWANRSGVPGTENLPVPEPGDGIAAWFVPADAGFVVQLRFPAAELAELRAALFGNTALLDLPL